MMATVHPGNIPGEEPGKSSNEAWAAKAARAAVDELGHRPGARARSPRATPTRCSTRSTSRRWRSPSPPRSAATCRSGRRRCSSTTTSGRSRRRSASRRGCSTPSSSPSSRCRGSTRCRSRPTRSRSSSCERCGYWDPAVIPEDWHAYLNCLFETGEEIATHPIFLPTMGDATDGDGWRDAVKNRFEQLKRHSWGAEDVGYIYGQLTAAQERAWRSSTLFRFGQVLHDHAMRVTDWVVLTSVYVLIGLLLATALVRPGLAPLRSPRTSCSCNVLFTVGTVGHGRRRSSSSCGAALRPTASRSCGPPSRSSFAVVPAAGARLLLGMLPALEAQTRLMFGIPLGYKVTPKRFAEPCADQREAA